MANILTTEFQKLWSNLIESLRLECESKIQNPDTDAVKELVRRILTEITCLA
jgi:hypothetical protein